MNAWGAAVSRARRARVAPAALLVLLVLAAEGAGHAAVPDRADAPAPVTASSGVRRFALIIGNNTPPRAALSVLRYADDDALRWTGLLATFGAETELLTRLDAETVRLAGAEAPPHHAPTRAELRAAMGRLAGSMKRAREAGSPTVFFFVFAGHGDVDKGEGSIALEDGPFHRRELEDEVLALSPADTNHVIVDACRSAYLAYDRGPGGSRRAWSEPYFAASTVSRFPNTGFLLANSSGGASHEWEEFQAGIFSHELRSGMLGGADADRNGRITYRELAAFVRVANEDVRNEKFRPSMLAIPPRDGGEVVVSLADALGGRVRLGAGRTGRHLLEDQLGIRWADVHPGLDQDLTLVLPTSATPRLFLRTFDGETEYALNRDANAELGAMAARRSSVARRGALNEAFEQLFARPFDRSALEVSLALTPGEADAAIAGGARPRTAEPRRHRVLEASLLAGSVASLAISGALFASTSRLRSSSTSASGLDRAGVNAEIQTRNRWTLATAVTGGALALAGAALFGWDCCWADSR